MSNDRAKLPAMAKVAVAVAFLFVVFSVVSSIRQPLVLLPAIIPLCAGIGILLRRAWSAYGYALVSITSIAVIPLVIGGAERTEYIQLVAAGAFAAILGAIFFFAGKSLAKSGAKRGFAWPWVTLSLIQTVPFVFFHAYVLPTGSMENTMIIGDHFLVWQFPKPKLRDGDLVVFRYPIDPRQIYTKRVIGVAGDRIHIASRVVYRNGVSLTEPYVLRSFPQDQWRDSFPHNPAEVPSMLENRSAEVMESLLQSDVRQGELIVPPGKYFVLGDNRDNSLDSRYWGLVDESEIIGKPVLIYYSPGHWDRLMKLL